MLPPRFLTSFAETLRLPPSSVLFSLFCFYLWSSSSPTGFTRSTKFVSIACPSDLQYLSSFSISFSHHGHICHCNHNCLQPSLSYNFRLGVGGRMGDNFFQRLLSNKNKYDFDIHTAMKRKGEREKRNIETLSTDERFLTNSTHLS